MIRGWATAAIGLLAAAAVVAGLVLTGGPGQARKERRDRQRESDLASLAGMVDCLARENGGRPPAAIAATPACDWQVPLQDAFTGAAYVYEVTGPRSYRLCATFDLPPAGPPMRGSRDAQGCISHEVPPMTDIVPQSGAPQP
ncbi:hypothetical protein [Paracoccus sp. (in: a-proteobacteria)]|uniref:hypothetical protein n=1 Tax=Paracoccus sp. TaxID=267 RepID=UPI0032206DDB